MIDPAKLKPGVLIEMKDGERGIIRGSYMSSDGIILTVRTNPASACDRNVPLDQIQEVIE